MKEIEVNNLTRTFGNVVAVDHISFEVEEGEIFGFLGANGAGKTTTIMMLATALNSTSGTASVCGYDITKNRAEVRKSIAVVFEEMSLDIRLTARENLDFHARMYHLDRKARGGENIRRPGHGRVEKQGECAGAALFRRHAEEAGDSQRNAELSPGAVPG